MCSLHTFKIKSNLTCVRIYANLIEHIDTSFQKDVVLLQKLISSPNNALYLKKGNCYVPSSKDMAFDEEKFFMISHH